MEANDVVSKHEDQSVRHGHGPFNRQRLEITEDISS